MKNKNIIPIEEARQLNAAGDRPIDRLDSRTLERHLENVYLFKLGLKNSFGIDFRIQLVPSEVADSPAGLMNYLSEVTPMARHRARELPKGRQNIYTKLEDEAVKSFWEIYYRFQPLIHHHAKRASVELDDLGNVLGRAILLYEKNQGAKFYTYLDKTLRESVKNLRGRVLADQYYLPLSAGRLLPQLIWLLDQEAFKLQRRLTPEESDELVVTYLRGQAASFSESTMRWIAQVARTRTRALSLDREMTKSGTALATSLHGILPLEDTTNAVDDQDECEFALRRIRNAFERAEFTAREQAVLLARLNLSHDEDLLSRIENEISPGALRNQKQKLLVRFTAALHAEEAHRFGRFLNSEPQASRVILRRVLSEFAESRSITAESFIQQILNHMSLTTNAYRLTISERGRLEQFLAINRPHAPASSTPTTIEAHLYNKFKAALLEQDARGFPCLLDDELAS